MARGEGSRVRGHASSTRCENSCTESGGLSQRSSSQSGPGPEKAIGPDLEGHNRVKLAPEVAASGQVLLDNLAQGSGLKQPAAANAFGRCVALEQMAQGPAEPVVDRHAEPLFGPLEQPGREAPGQHRLEDRFAATVEFGVRRPL